MTDRLRRSLLVLIFTQVAVVVSPASAAPFADIGRSLAWSKNVDGLNYEVDAPWLLRAGWSFEPIDAFIEAATFTRVDGDSSGSVRVVERQETLWARKTVDANFIARPYAGLGVGARDEQATTQFLGREEVVRGKPVLLMVLAAGAVVDIGAGFVATFEGRLSSSRGYAPNPLFGASVLIGYKF